MGNWNRDIFNGRRKQLIGRLQRHWARLREDHALALRAASDCLLGALQERYGRQRALIEVRVRRIERGL